MERDSLLGFIENEGLKIIETTFSDEAINNAFKEHLITQSVLPIRHRVLGGLYQSINIKIGNFLEILLKKILDEDSEYTLVSSINTSLPVDKDDFRSKLNDSVGVKNLVEGGKSTSFIISKRNQTLIDEYITACTMANANKNELPMRFEKLLKDLVANIKDEKAKPYFYEFVVFKNDVDLLFFRTNNNHYFYVELKKEDNHDSGKTIDMYKKVIKTFACLLYQEYSNDNKDFFVADFTPILLFFGGIKNPSKILPEDNIYSGETFFEKFLTLGYSDMCNDMCDISNSKTINDYLYSRVERILQYSNEDLLVLLDAIIDEEANKTSDTAGEDEQICLYREVISKIEKIVENQKLNSSDINYLEKRLLKLEPYGICTNVAAIKEKLIEMKKSFNEYGIASLTQVKDLFIKRLEQVEQNKEMKVEELRNIYRKKYNRNVIEKYV